MRLPTRAVRLVGAVALISAPMTATLVFATAAGAADTTFHVTNTNDAGDGSLRKALDDAAANPGTDVVEVDVSGTITLTTGPISWNGDLPVTINGHGITLNAGGAPAALVDAGGDDVTINGMTITGVSGSISDDAAPVLSEGGTVTMSDCVITGNNAHSTDGDAAGAILSEGGAVSISGCTLSNNTGTADDGDVAGGINSEGGAVQVSASAIRDNTGTGGPNSFGDAAGGILSEGGSIVVGENSTITGNSATTNEGDAAGGINSQGGTITVASSVVSGNTGTAGSDFDAGGGVLSSGNSVTVRSSTLNCNSATAPDGSAGGAILGFSETVTINDSFVQGNTAVGRNASNQANAIFVGNSGTIDGTGNTINDDFSVCAAPSPPPTPAPVQPTFTG